MRLELTGRHVRITPGLKRLVDERLEKLDRLLHDRVVSMQVVLDIEKSNRHRVEMTLHLRGDRFFHGTGSGANWEVAVNQALGKVNQQARRQKGKWDEGKRRGISAAKAASAAPRPERGGRGFSAERDTRRKRRAGEGAAPVAEPRVVRVRSRAAKPMTIEDAAAELGDGNDAVIVFRNSQNDAVTVLFRRPDGNLGLIEPEA
jgi:putative sigma-54 modulation protein